MKIGPNYILRGHFGHFLPFICPWVPEKKYPKRHKTNQFIWVTILRFWGKKHRKCGPQSPPCAWWLFVNSLKEIQEKYTNNWRHTSCIICCSSRKYLPRFIQRGWLQKKRKYKNKVIGFIQKKKNTGNSTLNYFNDFPNDWKKMNYHITGVF